MERESMVFYKSFFEAIDSLPEEEQAKCYRAVINYGLTGEEPEKGTLGYTMWLAFRKQIDVNQKRFENSKKRKKANSDHSATKTEPNCDQTATNIEPNVNVNVNDNVNVNENVNVNAEDISSPNGEDVSAEPTAVVGKRVPYQEIVDEYMRVCVTMPKVRLPLNEKRKEKIRKRLKSFTLDDIFTAFQKANDSDFLSGRNGKWTACDFDWFFTSDDKITHILEGRHDNRVPTFVNPVARELDDFYNRASDWASRKEGEGTGT